jgi:hypothetical protein
VSTNEAGAPPEGRPLAEPEKLLAAWMAWERGDVTPGQTLADLKRGGMRELLESTLQAQHELFGTPDPD